MHSGMGVPTATVSATLPRHCPRLSTVCAATIGSRSHATQTQTQTQTKTQTRLQHLVALAATLALGLGAGTANADDTVPLVTQGDGRGGTTAQALDADESTPVAAQETRQVVDGLERPGANVEGTTTTSTPATPPAPVSSTEGTAAAKKPMSRRGRIKELEDIKDELAKKELELLSKENALLEKEQSITVLRQELEIERKLRELVTKEKEDAEEEALLSKSLCTGSTMLP